MHDSIKKALRVIYTLNKIRNLIYILFMQKKGWNIRLCYDTLQRMDIKTSWSNNTISEPNNI